MLICFQSYDSLAITLHLTKNRLHHRCTIMQPLLCEFQVSETRKLGFGDDCKLDILTSGKSLRECAAYVCPDQCQ
jgi:hypothetical protein